MLNVKIPNFCKNEILYSLELILGEFLGLSFEAEVHDSSYIKISNKNNLGEITLDSSFFEKAQNSWLKNNSMPKLPLKYWIPADDGLNFNLVDKKLPVIYGEPGLIKKDKYFHINIDIFGSAFFMLSRYEELVSDIRDNHNRFPASESLSFKGGFLDRPIINEYVEILKDCLTILWPDLILMQRNANNFITCDVDWPYEPALYSSKFMIKKFIKTLILDKDIKGAFKSLYSYLLVKLNLSYRDPNRDGIEWIMKINELYGNRVAFYFITHNTSKLDTLKDEEFNSSDMRALFKEIKQRGHEIGVHPGYETYNNPKNFKQTVDKIRKIINEESIDQKNIGGRQHFLRWDTSQTPKLCEANNLSYDSTLSYADMAGFRCGICYEYTMYDLIDRRPMHLKQRPLIIMECSIIANRYEGLGYSDESMTRFENFKKICHQFNGTFNLLWHNSHLKNSNDKIFYERLIK